MKKPLFGWFSGSFNATNLGWSGSVGDDLRECYARMLPNLTMKAYPFRMGAHAFVRYAGHQVLAQMLSDSGVPGVRPGHES